MGRWGEASRRPVGLVSEGYELPCEIWLPEERSGEVPVCVVICHGSTQKGMRHELVQALARSLSARWPVLTLELPGFGRAPELIIRSTEDYLFHKHLLAAARLARRLTGLPAVLVGHSMGGRVSLQAASLGQEEGLVVGISTIAGLYELPNRPEHMLALVEDFARFVRVRLELPPERLAREVAEMGPTRRAIERLRIPLLAVEAGREVYGFIRETRYRLFRLARCPKTLVLLGHADHKFKGHLSALAEVLARWLERHFR